MLDIKTKKLNIHWTALSPLISSGLSVQVRSIAIELAFLAVTRATQISDPKGINAAAHSISLQLWQLGGIVLFAMSTVSSILIPLEISQNERDLSSAKLTANRLLLWGIVLGVALGIVQLLAIPLVGAFSKLSSVREASKTPAIIGAFLQLINGVVFIGEGIQQGNQAFGSLALTTLTATLAQLVFLAIMGHTLGGIWGSLVVFYLVRLCGCLFHHFFRGPFSKMNSQKKRI